MAMKGDGKSLSFVEDTAVAPEKLRDYIERFLAIVRGHGTVAGVYAHASVGCLHVRPVVDMKTAAGVRLFETIANDVADLVLEFGGALSGEHGDGMVRGPFTEKMFGPALYEAFRTVKRTFDPDGLFNPGKIVDTPPLTANLRFGAGYQTPDPPAVFDYTEFGGLGRAVEMCSGLGVCRKTLEGTMCPSYMATREEKHSTRGRANTLRLAMAGKLGEAGLNDHDVHDVLDLCLECRACKAECPVGVDVARFKSEFLATYWRRHGAADARPHDRPRAAAGGDRQPLRAAVEHRRAECRRTVDQRAAARHRSAPDATCLCARNIRATIRTSRPDLISPAPPSPQSPAPSPWCGSLQRHVHQLQPPGNRRRRGFLPRGCRPNAASFAARMLRPPVDLPRAARRSARGRTGAMTDALHDAAARGERIVFLEPSCLSAVREDAPDLLRGEAQRRARVVAGACVLFEDYVEEEWREGRINLALRPGPSTVLLHGHCHQKAMGLMPSARALAARVPSCTVVDLDAGCCGMAGSFGYAKEHYDVSRQIGERKLLPAARAMSPDAVLVAAGTSCREQVNHFAGVRAMHPAELLASLIARR